MAWSKVRGSNHPLGWWFHKIMCEFGYTIGRDGMYYKHLNIMVRKYKTNLYGEKLNR